ncbi:MAG: helix-turn-helix domain-containing protein [Opitutae bacterium]|nr:helix-turn-helix domain-containing protein [Opitutae bacterium]MBC9888277.1 helix-turn-helix domain-containing protein [Opitutae bacterium]
MTHCRWRAEAPLKVELCGISYCDGSYRMRRRNSKFTVIEYIIHGTGTLEVGNQVHYPKEGDVYFVTEGSNHEYRADPSDPWTKIWFNTSGPLPLALLDIYGLRGVNHIPSVSVEPLFREGYEACVENPSQAEQVVAITLHNIFMELSTVLRARHESPVRQSQGLHDYIDSCVEETPSLAEMAKILGRSPSQTIRIFKREWGTTPYHFLIERKFQKARILLTGSVKSVKEIAYGLGFKSEYHFSALFKQKTGMSPKTYRNSILH